MNILAFETATDPGSLALWINGQVIEKHCPAEQSNSQTLLPLMFTVLSAAGLRLSDIDAVAFGVGPGSFTGLRVACGVAQGLAVGLQTQRKTALLGVGTLDAMAFACAEGAPTDLSGSLPDSLSNAPKQVLVCLDARMHEVYYGLFECTDSAVKRVGAIGVYAPSAVPLPNTNHWLACGNGLSAYPQLHEHLGTHVCCWQPAIAPSAAAIAKLAAPRLARGESIDPSAAIPFYVRDKVAKTIVERLAEGGKA